MASEPKIILSGMRPTGRLHLGNYWGALARWLELQANPEFRCFFMVADLHALTTGYEDVKSLKKNVEEMVLDWLAAGLDPEKSVIFQQSRVPEHAELSLLLSMITPLGWLERIPTYKDQLRELEGREITTHGFLGYPVLQTADILLYKAHGVPVGEDQLSHVELSQDIARRFNHLFGAGGALFPEPKALLGRTPRVPGLDNRKMSKSYDNAIELTDDADRLMKKISRMFTDPKKVRANDHGHPEGCVVYAMHRIYNPQADVREKECKDGTIGCVACKKHLHSLMAPAMKPLQDKRAALAAKPGAAWEALEKGNARARAVASATLDEAMKAMGIR
jgi:tryptophanyl-tRNA synthetase